MDRNINEVVRKKTLRLSGYKKLTEYKEYFNKNGYSNISISLEENLIKFSNNNKSFKLDVDYCLEPEYMLELVKINLL